MKAGFAAWPVARQALSALGALAAGAAAGAVAVSGGLVQLDFRWSPQFAIAALAGALLLLAMAARPLAGIALLLILAYSNASEILVREHGFPSVLQLLVPLLLVILAVTPRRPAALEIAGPRPDHAFLLASMAWLGVLLLSTTWAWDKDPADEAVIATLKAVLLALVAGWAIADLRALTFSAWILVATGTALSLLSSFQVLTGAWDRSFGGFARVKQAHIAGTSLGPRATGPLADPNFYAQALLPLVPIALALALGSRSRAARIAGWIASGVLVTGIATTYSRGGALALFVVLGLFAFAQRARIRPRHVVIALAALAIGATFLPASYFVQRIETLAMFLPGHEQPFERHDSSVAKRRVLMAAAAGMALDNPMFGVGAGNYGAHFETHASQVGAQARIYHDPGERAFAHSLPLEIAAETGLVGLVAFAGVASAALFAALRARRRFSTAGSEPGSLLALGIALGIVGILVSSLILHGDYPRYPWLMFGLGIAAWRCSVRAGARAPA